MSQMSQSVINSSKVYNEVEIMSKPCTVPKVAQVENICTKDSQRSDVIFLNNYLEILSSNWHYDVVTL